MATGRMSGPSEQSGSDRARDDVRRLGEQASEVVRQAAGVFEEELSAGLQEARRLQRQFTGTGRLAPGDLDEVAARVRSNAHLLIDMVAERFGDLSSAEVQDLSSRFTKDAHEVFDAVMDLVDAAPAVVNKLVELADAQRAPRSDRGPADAPVDVPSDVPSDVPADVPADVPVADAGSVAPPKKAAPPQKAAPRKSKPRKTT